MKKTNNIKKTKNILIMYKINIKKQYPPIPT
jgi:hypothetical protein